MVKICPTIPYQANATAAQTLDYDNASGSEPWVKKAAFLASCDGNNYTIAEGTHDYVIHSYTGPLGYTGTFPNNPIEGGDELYCIRYNPAIENIRGSIDDETFEVEATVYRDGPEHDRLWAQHVAALPHFGKYEAQVAGNPARGIWKQSPKAKINWAAKPPQFPTTPSSLVELQATISQVTRKLEQLQLDKMVGELRQAVKTLDTTLKSADTMVKHMDADVVPETKATLEEARKALAAAKQTLASDTPLQQDLREALRELARTAQSLRVLTDYLERHPESLIRGKQEDKP